MADRVVIAFGVAAVVVLLAGAVLRAVARRSKSPWARRSGGVVLVLTVPVGLVAAEAVPGRALAVVAGAIVLAAFGVVRDRFTVPRWVVPIVMGVVAVAVASSGLRFPLGGVPAVDFAWTVVWLALVTTVVANSGNADGQLPSLTAASTLGVLGLAAFAYQSAAATLAAALLGGLLAFLAYNVRPASLFMGRAGGLFAGFMIASGAIWVRPSIGRPESLGVSVLLVGVALLDGFVVLVSRLRRNRRLGVRLRDHMAHRLVAAGLRPTRAIRLLAAVQLTLSVLAVFVGRGVLAPWVGALAAGLLLTVLTVFSLRARMLESRAPGFSGRVWAVVFGLVAFVIVASLPAAAAAFSSRSKMISARDYANAAIRAARDGNSDRAAALFTQAEEEFTEAHDRLASIATVPSLVVPVLGSNMHAVRELSRIGVELSRTGRELAQTVRSDQIRFVDGRVPMETVAEVTPALEKAARVLGESERDIQEIRTPYLLGEVKEALTELRSDLTGAARDATRAAAAARVAPEVLGAEQPRRYLLLVQNPAELRGTGGLIGNWGILTAADGKVELESLERIGTLNAMNPGGRVLDAPDEYVERYGRFDPARSMQNSNISPDFPTVAAVFSDLYAQSGNPPVDGVMAVDPIGLSALLDLTGPVRLPEWPTPITSENVVDVTLRDAYAEFARTPERADFLGDVARAVIDDATSGELGNLAAMSRTLGKAAHEGHLSLWFPSAAAEEVVDTIEIGGRVPLPRGDSLLVTNTNASANKLDFYLDRAVDYSLTVTPSADLREGAVDGTVTVGLTNLVPPSGLPQIVAGPYEGATDRFVYGQNRTFLSLYTPLGFTGARLDGEPTGLEVATELGRNVYSTYLDVFPQQTVELEVDVAGVVRLSDDGWYELTLVRQPTLRADRVTVVVSAPPGWEVLDARGLEVFEGRAQGAIDLERTESVRVRLGKSGPNLWDRLRAGT